MAKLKGQAATPPPTGRSRGALAGLSEAWAVQAKHEGCYTGGKVVWAEAIGSLACLCDEELHLVSISGDQLARRVRQEADAVLTFAVDPSGESACTSHRSGLLRHFRLGNPPTLVRSWKAHDQVVSDVDFDATGSFVASGSVDKSAKVWDFAGYFCTHSFRGHPALVSLVRFHPSKLQLVTVADTEVRLWDLQSSSCVGIMKDHLTSISSLAFGKVKAGHYQLVTGGRDQVVNVWQLETSALARSVPVFENVEGVATVPVRELKQACSEKGSHIEGPFAKWLQSEAKVPPYVVLTVGDKCVLRAWNPLDGRCVATLASPHAAKGTFRQVLCVEHAGGRRIVTIGEDMNLVVWSLPEFKVASYIMGHNEEIVHVQFIPRLRWTGGAGESEETPAAEAGKLAIDVDRFVCIANDEHPRVVNTQGFGASLLRGHTDLVISCDVSADGMWIATGGKDQSVRVWSSESCRCACVVTGHTGAVSALSFAKKRPKGPKGAAAAESQPVWLVTGSQDKTMKLWELPTPRQLLECASSGGEGLSVKKSKVAVIAHTKEVNDVLVAPNNKVIASAGQDKLVRIWSFPEAQLMGECKGHRRGVWCVAFSPIDQVLASASGDSTVRLWNLRDYSPIRAFQGHTGAVLRVGFLANGMQLMTSGADGLLKLWQIRTADCAATLEEHTAKVWCLDIVGDRMLSGGSDSKLVVWRDVTLEQAKERQDAQAELATKDTRIGLLVRQGQVEEALTLALELERPGQMRQIITEHAMGAISKKLSEASRITKEESAGFTGGLDLQRWVGSLEPAQLEKFIGLLDVWNSNRRMAPLAQMFLNLLLAVVPPERLAAAEGMNATCTSLLSYSARHLARTEALLQKTFLFDLVLQSSGVGLALMDDFKPSLTGSGDGAPTKARPGAAEDALKRTMEVLLGGGEEGDAGGEVAAEAAEAHDAEAEDDADESSDAEFEGALMVPDEKEEDHATRERRRRRAVVAQALGADPDDDDGDGGGAPTSARRTSKRHRMR